jgi:hypothetical protein
VTRPWRALWDSLQVYSINSTAGLTGTASFTSSLHFRTPSPIMPSLLAPSLRLALTLFCCPYPFAHDSPTSSPPPPQGIGASVVLDGLVEGRGVLTPITSDIYTPCLERLEAEGGCWQSHRESHRESHKREP